MGALCPCVLLFDFLALLGSVVFTYGSKKVLFGAHCTRTVILNQQTQPQAASMTQQQNAKNPSHVSSRTPKDDFLREGDTRSFSGTK